MIFFLDFFKKHQCPAEHILGNAGLKNIFTE
jgi:hypothetical protein